MTQVQTPLESTQQTALASMLRLRLAYEQMLITYHSTSGFTAAWHFDEALKSFGDAAHALGFDLVPRQPASAPMATEAEPEAVL
jgi:hypothetical protein